ncbi:ferritin [Tichowtungia aerotolerans]|uniref:Ferritin n=1 Tax=Tichowtungia aerotolerans TaxID=2697043 RepID=A0A6P1MB06_9BACT|nr:ferritin [Tichowtungia aerotolerans]QHI69724.1 ferritin [Tichowtungia aerotolerans]
MITKRMEEALNEQINKEFYSAYLYLSMSAYCNRLGMPGAEHWFRMQYDEEIMHMSKMFDYVMQHGGNARLMQIDEPPNEFGTILEIFQASLAHEQFVTKSINELLDVAVEEKDHASQVFLQWYITEQVEEEANVEDIVNRLKLADENGGALMMIDDKLSQRLPPTPATAQ